MKLIVSEVSCKLNDIFVVKIISLFMLISVLGTCVIQANVSIIGRLLHNLNDPRKDYSIAILEIEK